MAKAKKVMAKVTKAISKVTNKPVKPEATKASVKPASAKPASKPASVKSASVKPVKAVKPEAASVKPAIEAKWAQGSRDDARLPPKGKIVSHVKANVYARRHERLLARGYPSDAARATTLALKAKYLECALKSATVADYQIACKKAQLPGDVMAALGRMVYYGHLGIDA